MVSATKPLVPVSDGLGVGTVRVLQDVAGTAANVALVLSVAAVVFGAMFVGASTLMRYPHWAMRGWSVVVGGVCAAILSVGLNGFLAWFGGYTFTLWNT